MLPENKVNINTPRYWDEVYKKEAAEGKTRHDEDRLNFIRRFLKGDNPEENFLDVGCGNCEMLRWLNNSHPKLKKYGSDICEKTLRHIQEGWPDWTLKPASIYALPYADNFFDYVFCGETIEHLENPTKAFDELVRVTRPLGRIIITLPNEDRNPSPEHLWQFTIRECIEIAERYGALMDIKVLCSGLSICFAFKKKDR